MCVRLYTMLSLFVNLRTFPVRRQPSPADLQTNFVSEKPSSFYADLYKADNLPGGHVIMLGADAASKCVASFDQVYRIKCKR